jgi:hypothetical protein
MVQSKQEQEQSLTEQEPSFPSWAFSTMQKMRKAVGIGAILAAAFSIRALKPQTWAGQSLKDLGDFIAANPQPRANLAFIQAATCFLLALLTPRGSLSRLQRRKNIDSSDISTAIRACNRINLFVRAIYLTWSVYYLVTGLFLTGQPSGGAQETLFDRTVFISLNTLPSLVLFWLYVELAEFTVDTPTQEKKKRRKIIPIETTPSIDAAVPRILSLGVFAIIIVPLWYAFGSNREGTVFVLDVVSSCLNGVALALVVGRLGSKYIDPGSLTLGLLYFYAVIQPTAATFPNVVIGHLLATTVALPLKVLLWLVIVWAFTTGILAEYVLSIRVLLIRRSEHLEQE